MAEYDSDLEGKEEQITIHDGSQSNTTNSSKKRKFHEMEDDDNHYSAKHSKNKSQKLDHESNDNVNDFLNDSASEEDDIDESQQEDITFDDTSTLIQHVEFELKDMEESYYHEVKDILAATEWDQKKLNVVQLTDIIIQQEEIGGVLLSQTAVLGFITLLSFKKYFEHLSLAHIKRFILNRCKQSVIRKKFEYYLSKKHNTGLLLHERPVNVPLELVPHIWESLGKDMEYATDKKEAKHLSNEEVELFRYDYMLMVVRYRWIPSVDKEDKGDKEEAEDAQDVLLPHLENDRNKMTLVYEHLEDDLFVKKARFQFDFERNGKVWNVILVKMTDLKDIVQQMHHLYDTN
eukprot:265609_1